MFIHHVAILARQEPNTSTVVRLLCPHVHDVQATILLCLGFDHERLAYHHAGRDFRLTDVHGRVIREILA